MPLIGREQSNNMVALLPPEFIQGFLSLLPSVRGLKGKKRGGKEKNSRISRKSSYTAPLGFSVFETSHKCGPG